MVGPELKRELIMRRALAFVAFASLVGLPFSVFADDKPDAQPSPGHASVTNSADSDTHTAPAAAAPRAQAESKTAVSPIAVTAKRTRPRLDLKLTSQSMDRVLDESGVEPVAESEESEIIEVTGHHVEQEPIMIGIPALFYGITHPTEAWRIFAPIQP
jgi:hypothetical protein